ncbi:MAG: RraA family protein [Anaerolineae bacterium]|nr:RraA family protein [Anaerolineae bacterium]
MSDVRRSQNVGFRVFTQIPRPPRELVEAFAKLESTYVTDAMNRFGGMDANIQPAHPAMKATGPAVTVRVPPGDNLMVYKAMEVAQPGDVIVIEARGFVAVAQWGDMVSMIGRGLGLAGMVTDGSLRDLKGILAEEWPVFSKPYLTPNGDLKDGPGEVNVPVAVGGVPVLPGDIIVADGSGVVVVPLADAEAVLPKAQAVAADEVHKIRAIREGHLIPAWLNPTLEQKGCEIIQGTWNGKR